MTVRDIRITFFYADEGIWDYVKKHKIRDRVVQWADEFYQYHKYDFKIEHSPIPYNERVYKKKFCLSKTKGFVAHNVNLSQLDAAVRKKRKEKMNIKAMRKLLGLTDALSDSDKLLWASFADAELKIAEEIETLEEKYADRFEAEIRPLLYPVIASLNSAKERLPVLFCSFLNWNDGAVGTTPPKTSSGFFWAVPTVFNRYSGTFIMIGVNNMSKRSDLVLAHEIGHAAGCLHQDGANNLMKGGRENDNFGKLPADLIMEPDDLTRLEIAPFVK